MKYLKFMLICAVFGFLACASRQEVAEYPEDEPQNGYYDENYESVKNMISLYDTSSQMYDEAVELLKQGQNNKAKALFERSCELGFADSCMQRGFFDATGDSAKPWYKRACDELHHAQGCFFVYINTMPTKDKKSSKAQIQESFEYIKKASEFDSQNATYLNLLAGAYKEGQGVAENPQKAFEIFKAACDDLNDGMSCVNTGWAYYDGWGTKKDLSQADFYFDKGCIEKSGKKDCSWAVIVLTHHTKKKDYTRAKRYFYHQCGYSEESWNLGCKTQWEIDLKGKLKK